MKVALIDLVRAHVAYCTTGTVYTISDIRQVERVDRFVELGGERHCVRQV